MPSGRDITYPKTKKYVVIKAVDNPDGVKGSWKEGQVIRINPGDHKNYIAGRFIVPFETAITQYDFDPLKGRDTKPAVTQTKTTSKESDPKPDSSKKQDVQPKAPAGGSKSAPSAGSSSNTDTTTEPKPTTKTTTSTDTQDKKVIDNSLKASVQEKKAELKKEEEEKKSEASDDKKASSSSDKKIDADKLAAIKSGGKK